MDLIVRVEFGFSPFPFCSPTFFFRQFNWMNWSFIQGAFCLLVEFLSFDGAMSSIICVILMLKFSSKSSADCGSGLVDSRSACSKRTQVLSFMALFRIIIELLWL